MQPVERKIKEQCGSGHVLGGASKDSWVESAGSVWFRSVRGQLASDWVALGLIQILKHCAKK